MSDKGRERFEHSYDDLAVAALKFMSSQSGNQLVDGFAQSRADDIERKALDSMAKNTNKTAALASFLTEQGYAASVDNKAMGQELIQHHCTIAHVAAQNQRLADSTYQRIDLWTARPQGSKVKAKSDDCEATTVLG